MNQAWIYDGFDWESGNKMMYFMDELALPLQFEFSNADYLENQTDEIRLCIKN